MKFPKTVFLKVDGETGEEFFLVENSLEDAANIGETIPIAEYRLVSVKKVKGSTKIKIL